MCYITHSLTRPAEKRREVRRTEKVVLEVKYQVQLRKDDFVFGIKKELVLVLVFVRTRRKHCAASHFLNVDPASN